MTTKPLFKVGDLVCFKYGTERLARGDELMFGIIVEIVPFSDGRNPYDDDNPYRVQWFAQHTIFKDSYDRPIGASANDIEIYRIMLESL